MSGVLSRDSAKPIAIALLCILGIGMAAATLETAEPIESDGGFAPQQPDQGGEPVEPGQGNPPVEEPEGEPSNTDSGMTLRICIEFLASAMGIGLILAVFFAAVGLIYSRYNFSTALLAGWTLFPPTMLVWFLTTNCGSGEGSSMGNNGGGGPDPGQSPIQPVTDIPPSLLAGAVGIVLVGAVVLLYRSAGGDETVIIEETEDDEPDLDEFAAAAGRAADRIEERNADVDNSVYQAWLEMTSLLNVDSPETYSAGEFADEAIDLGMAESDVRELTRLFNEVRYGGKDAETREDQAVSILRTIESGYGESADVDLDAGNETDRPIDTDDTEDTQ